MRSFAIALLLVIAVAIVSATVLAMYRIQQNNFNLVTQYNSSISGDKSNNYIISSSTKIAEGNTSVTNSSIIVLKNITMPLSEGIYLLKNSNVVYIVYYEPITQLKIFNYTFIRGGPISTFNGVLELQNTTIYQELENQKEVTVQIYNGTSWKTITLDIVYTTQVLQPYGFLVPSNEIEPF